eukprot:GEMP01032492.1.p2 GENE.GEMP01032492.1~~GEMP01032492.1.p2  ORF type:complete len:128 (-),score=16.92 GEMP01032492.1:1651-2034(-)
MIIVRYTAVITGGTSHSAGHVDTWCHIGDTRTQQQKHGHAGWDTLNKNMAPFLLDNKKTVGTKLIFLYKNEIRVHFPAAKKKQNEPPNMKKNDANTVDPRKKKTKSACISLTRKNKNVKRSAEYQKN